LCAQRTRELFEELQTHSSWRPLLNSVREFVKVRLLLVPPALSLVFTGCLHCECRAWRAQYSSRRPRTTT
jgi:hypothetical protein